jgi:hypothetical protein
VRILRLRDALCGCAYGFVTQPAKRGSAVIIGLLKARVLTLRGTVMKAATTGLILLVFVAIGGYLAAGGADTVNSDMVQQPRQTATVQSMPSNHEGKSLPAVEDMLGQLEQRLEREPDDAKGWSLLGRSYEFLGRTKEAEAAFARAEALGYQHRVSAKSRPASVRGVVRLDPALAGKVSGEETVFIFARAVSGPRVPVAVLRRTAKELPIEFELDDSMSMTPEYKLSGFGKVIVGARLSASGEAGASTGDLEGYSTVVDVNGSEEVVITIDQSVLTRASGIAGEG